MLLQADTSRAQGFEIGFNNAADFGVVQPIVIVAEDIAEVAYIPLRNARLQVVYLAPELGGRFADDFQCAFHGEVLGHCAPKHGIDPTAFGDEPLREIDMFDDVADPLQGLARRQPRARP